MEYTTTRNTREVGFSLPLMVAGVQWLTQEKEPCKRSLVMKCKHGSMSKEDCRCLQSTRGTQKASHSARKRFSMQQESKQDARHVDDLWRVKTQTWNQKLFVKAVDTVTRR